MVLLDIRFTAEITFARYWTFTPKANEWREIASKIAEEYPNDSSDETDNLTKEMDNQPEKMDNRPGKKTEPRGPLLPSKKKMFALFDEEFFKWVYVAFHSLHPKMIEMRHNFSPRALVKVCGDLAYILTSVHGDTRKESRSKLLNKSISGTEIAETLKEEFEFDDYEIRNVFILLGSNVYGSIENIFENIDNSRN